MFGKIINIGESYVTVECAADRNQIPDLLNIHVVFESSGQFILGEVESIDKDVLKIRLLGEFIGGKYVNGVLRKPTLTSNLRIINSNELTELVGTYKEDTFKLGTSSLYRKYEVCPSLNALFANHMAIFGNTGSGKSCGVARIIQNIFANPKSLYFNSNIFIFDAYGEYKTAFKEINKFNENYSYKFITTNRVDLTDYELKLPFHLLNCTDLGLLLQASSHSQLTIIDRALRYAKIFSKSDVSVDEFKNHLVAKSILAVMYSNISIHEKKNQIFKIINTCTTPDFQFTSQLQGLGFTRTLDECLIIDSKGNFSETILLTDYLLARINDEVEKMETPKDCYYTLEDFIAAFDFTLISEGFLSNKRIYDDAMILKVRLVNVTNSKLKAIFSSDAYINIDSYISTLVNDANNRRNQIININLEDIDDSYAKVLVKVFSRIFFDFVKTRKDRASVPIHLFLEEAHRYIQHDDDVYMYGYNIFERIAKEGRKYGIILDLISQRPVEISETVISQCNNFLIFKMTHPRDLEYIEKMVPNISKDVIDKQKSLQPGTCVGFGAAFKIPMIVKMEMPNQTPNSSSCDVYGRWKTQNK